MKALYVHTVFNSLVVSWVIHMFLVSEDTTMSLVCLAVAILLLTSFPGYVDRKMAEHGKG